MRTDSKRIKNLAKDFARSTRARLWSFVTDDVRHALIDAAVMDCIRLSCAMGDQDSLAPEQIIEFRQGLIDALSSEFMRLDDPASRSGLADVDQE